MIIWQGWGFLALVIPIVMVNLADFLLYRILGMEKAALFGTMDIASALGALLSIVTLWFLGRWLNNRPEKILVDTESGERLVYKPRHSLFWIPLQYWGIIWLTGGLAAMFL
ncbi:MAG: hypothetical protein LBB51_05820 [Zoogloeaceae bacterium]|nr:hypothetical protein [Zoogloeaceae bacterium]